MKKINFLFLFLITFNYWTVLPDYQAFKWYKVWLADASGAVIGGISTLNPAGASAGTAMMSAGNVIGQLP